MTDHEKAYDDLRARVRAVRDHYASSRSFPPGALVPVDAVVTRLDRALLAPALASETAREGDRCPFIATDPITTRRPRDDGWRCGETVGPTHYNHVLYDADGERTLYAGGWTLPAPTPPTTVQVDECPHCPSCGGPCQATQAGRDAGKVRLTSEEREALNVAVDEAETCACHGTDYGVDHVYAAVERILAARQSNATEEAMRAYEAWRTAGQEMHRVLTDIWRLVDPEVDRHMTFGDEPQRVFVAVRDAFSADATEREDTVQWGVRWRGQNFQVQPQPSRDWAEGTVARYRNAATLVRRTVTTGEWTEVGE